MLVFSMLGVPTSNIESMRWSWIYLCCMDQEIKWCIVKENTYRIWFPFQTTLTSRLSDLVMDTMKKYQSLSYCTRCIQYFLSFLCQARTTILIFVDFRYRFKYTPQILRYTIYSWSGLIWTLQLPSWNNKKN